MVAIHGHEACYLVLIIVFVNSFTLFRDWATYNYLDYLFFFFKKAVRLILYIWKYMLKSTPSKLYCIERETPSTKKHICIL